MRSTSAMWAVGGRTARRTESASRASVPDATGSIGALPRILEESEAAFEAAAPPSLSLSIGAGGAIVTERAWGSSDVERHVEATPATAYLLASVTKPITA